MKVKTFKFLTFEEWNKTREYKQTIGEYKCEIQKYSWTENEITYEAVIKSFYYPLNKIIYEYFTCNFSDEEALREWYQYATTKLNAKWEKFILETYISEKDGS